MDLRIENLLKFTRHPDGRGKIDTGSLTDDPSVTRGKFLLLRTLEPARVVDGGFIIVAVTDAEGNGVMRLALRNYCHGILTGGQVELDDILPEGSYLAFQNPHPVSLISQDPSEVQLLSSKDVETIMGEEFDWSSPFWRPQQTSSDDEKAFFDKLRRVGNKLFVSNCFSDAVRYYDLALQYPSTDEERSTTLSNKAAALIRMRCNNAALEMTKLALELDPSNAKALYRMGKSLAGLGKVEEAAKELNARMELSSELKANQSLKELQAKIEEYGSRKTPFTPEEYISLYMYATNNGPLKIPVEERLRAVKEVTEGLLTDYVGPVEVRQCETPGKCHGRGLFATEDISPGQVVLACKAIAATQTRNTSWLNEPTCENRNLSVVESDTVTTLLTQVASQILFDPKVGSLVYQLSTGGEVEHLTEEDPATCVVDVPRLLTILDLNTTLPLHEEVEGLHICNSNCIGLWFLPSFINHTCSERNVVFEFYDELLIVKAVENIPKGAEILRSHALKHESYKSKQGFLNPYGFTCVCELCTLELEKFKDSYTGRRRRNLANCLKTIRQNPEGLLTNSAKSLGITPAQVLADVDFMGKLWESFPLPGLFENLGLRNMGQYLYEVGIYMDVDYGEGSGFSRYKDAYNAYSLAIKMAEHGPEKIMGMTDLVSCLVTMNRREEIFQYLKALKKELILWFGSIDAIRLWSPTFLQKLESQVGIDFFKD